MTKLYPQVGGASFWLEICIKNAYWVITKVIVVDMVTMTSDFSPCLGSENDPSA